VIEQIGSVNVDAAVRFAQLALAEPRAALYVRCIGPVRRNFGAATGPNAPYLSDSTAAGVSLLAQNALFRHTARFLNNIGELPIRRPNRAPPAATKDGPRTNDEIRNHEIQLIDQTGLNHGNVETITAIKMAMEAGMDLVEISPNTAPPVCKIMDYGKFKYSAQKKAAEARKKQKIVEIKEIKLRPMIDDHDYEVKMRAMQRFFEEGDKVKITLRYRGREMAHQEIGTKLLDKVKADVAEYAKVEQDARFEGRQVVMVLAPR
jgi:translation initiation factor IF-3